MVEKAEHLEHRITLPERVQVAIEKDELVIKGKQELRRKIKGYKAEVHDKELVIISPRATKRDKKKLGSEKAHIKNAFKGCNEHHVYKLKICAGHFPMNVTVQKNQVVIKNFLGEKVPRTTNIREHTEVKVEGEIITVSGGDKGLVSQMAADIQQITRRPGFDRRIFQDGIYITDKAGKKI
ncbi:MAG: 50S ribosomal protein L6 [Nanoarchaeota archaeon]